MQKACYHCHSVARAEEIQKTLQRLKGETAALNTDVRNTAEQFTCTVLKNCFVLFIVGNCGLLRLWPHCLKTVQRDSWHIVGHRLHSSLATQLPYPLPTCSTRARQELLLFNIIRYFKQEHTCNIFKSFVS